MWLLKPDFCLYVSTVLLRLQLSVLFVTVLKGSCLIQALCNLSTPRTISFFLSPPPPTSFLLSSHVFPIRYRFSPNHSAKNCEYRKNGCSGSHTLFKNANEYAHIFLHFSSYFENVSTERVSKHYSLRWSRRNQGTEHPLFVTLWKKVRSNRQQFSNGFQ